VKGLRCGDALFRPLVRETEGGYEVGIGEETFRFALSEESPGVFVLRDGPRTLRFHVARQGTTVHLFWEGETFELSEEREGARPTRRHEGGALEAPMPGRVVAVRAAPGQQVKKGEELLVVEAMKMENALRAPRDGRVRSVSVAVGEMVAPGRALVEIETEE
jgi:3-methylcrotonyl-CoA carboxylase alpha subunit